MRTVKFIKQRLCDLPFCYAVNVIQAEGRTKYIFATDDTGPCYAVDAQTLERELVWEGPGGTMSIVPVPGQDGTFLASQNFMPGFAAARARIVKVTRREGRWAVEPWMELPYVHRFDILERNGMYYFLGCILSGTDQEHAQWEVPGMLAAAPLSPDFAPPPRLDVIAGGMSRNHGYCKVQRPGFTQAYTACDQGVFQVTPPECPGGTWDVLKLIGEAVSDVAVCDIDGDGLEELAVISPFHGDALRIFRPEKDGYREIYRHPKALPFLHALWGGRLAGRPVFLAGCRGGDRELLLIQSSGGMLEARLIEAGFGSSNVAVSLQDGQPVLLTANRESHEAALFRIQEVDV